MSATEENDADVLVCSARIRGDLKIHWAFDSCEFERARVKLGINYGAPLLRQSILDAMDKMKRDLTHVHIGTGYMGGTGLVSICTDGYKELFGKLPPPDVPLPKIVEMAQGLFGVYPDVVSPDGLAARVQLIARRVLRAEVLDGCSNVKQMLCALGEELTPRRSDEPIPFWFSRLEAKATPPVQTRIGQEPESSQIGTVASPATSADTQRRPREDDEDADPVKRQKTDIDAGVAAKIRQFKQSLVEVRCIRKSTADRYAQTIRKLAVQRIIVDDINNDTFANSTFQALMRGILNDALSVSARSSNKTDARKALSDHKTALKHFVTLMCSLPRREKEDLQARLENLEIPCTEEAGTDATAVADDEVDDIDFDATAESVVSRAPDRIGRAFATTSRMREWCVRHPDEETYADSDYQSDNSLEANDTNILRYEEGCSARPAEIVD